MADLSQTAASVVGSAYATRLSQYKAGAAITAGNFVYLDSSSTWQKVDINAAATGNGITDVRGVAENSAPAAGQPLTVITKDDACNLGATLTPGLAINGSTNAGAITHDVPASGSYYVKLGAAKTAALAVIGYDATGTTV